jgi:hypothetical protein
MSDSIWIYGLLPNGLFGFNVPLPRILLLGPMMNVNEEGFKRLKSRENRRGSPSKESSNVPLPGMFRRAEVRGFPSVFVL